VKGTRVTTVLVVLALVGAATPLATVGVGASATHGGQTAAATGSFTGIQHNESGTASPADEPDIPEDATNLTVLMYNDIQTAISDPSAVGHLVGVVDERRAAHDGPTVVVGGGDQIGPNSLGPFTTWETPVDVLNQLDPAAEVIGNHDLDYGIDPVSEFGAESEFPWLLANLVQEDGSNMPGTQNYTVVERGDLRVGILGLVDEKIYAKTNIDFEGQGYRLADTVEVGSRIATELKEEEDVDVVIAATHIGVPGAERLANNTDNIDVIVTGDDEVSYGPKRVDGTAVVEAEGRAAYVGEVNLSVGEDRVVMRDDSRLISVQAADDPSTLPTDETTKQLVADLREQYLDQVAGETTVALDSRFTNYDDETRWGNFITDAFKNRTDSAVAITNAGGIRGNFVIPPGEVTYDDVYTSLPFGNYLVEKEMTGEQLESLLASQVTRLDAQFGSGASLQVSGVTYEFIDRPDADTAVRNVFVNGEPLEPEATYTVTVNSYMAGWDRIAAQPTVETDPTQYGTAVAEYLEERSPITPSDADRIRRVTRTASSEDTVVPDLNDTYTLTFDTPFVEDVAPETFRIENETSAVVEARSVSVDGDALTVTVNESRLRPMADSSLDLQLYGKYNDTEYTHEFLTYAVLNTNVPVAVPPTLGDSPAQNADDDLALEDVNGDGAMTVADVQLLFQNYESDAVQSNAELFDFNDDGGVTIGDVQTLFTEVVGSA